MKKINRKVFFEFKGFVGIEIREVKNETKVTKLYGKNFDKILNLLVSNMLTKGVNHQNGFVDIPSSAFKATLDNYKVYLQYLISQGYLERSYFVYKSNGKTNPDYLYKSYRKNKPFGYRFTELFKREIKIKRVIFIPNPNFDNSTIKSLSQNNKQYFELNINPEILKRLKQDFNTCQIIDTEIEKTNFPNSKFIDIDKWFYNQAELFKWKRADITFTMTSGRLYTNFTRLSSHVRSNNILLNNEKIFCKDISNSFPLMIALYCIKTNPRLVNDADFIEYCSWVTNGTFYENLKTGLNQYRNADEKHRLKVKQSKSKQNMSFQYEELKAKRLLSKDIVKVLFQIYLNGQNENIPFVQGYGNSLITDYMKMKFGAVHEQITRLKERDNCTYEKLVLEESQFIFQVVGTLHDKYPTIKLLTVHDSIYTTESDFFKLEKEWNIQFQKLIEILPTDEFMVSEPIKTEKRYIQNEKVKPIELIEIEELDDEFEMLSSKPGCYSNYQRHMNDEFWNDI